MTNIEIRNQNWKLWGEHFGYPQCCIDEFCNDEIVRSNKFDVAKNTGFIPCTKHAEQIRNGEIKLKDLIKNRKCKTNFPIS